MKTKRTKAPTEEQKAAAAERRAKIREACNVIKAMTPEARVLLASQYGIRNANGHELSLFNQCLLIHQLPGVSIVGGFQQWREQGRRVMKGARALAIWIPLHKGDASGEPDTGSDDGDTGSDGEAATRSRFIVGNVFDISQTESAADAERTAKTHEAEHVAPASPLPAPPVLALPAPVPALSPAERGEDFIVPTFTQAPQREGWTETKARAKGGAMIWQRGDDFATYDCATDSMVIMPTAPTLTIWDVEQPASGQQLLICPPPAKKPASTPPPPPLGDEFELCAA